MNHAKPTPPASADKLEDRAYLRRRRIVSVISLVIFAALVVWLTIVIGKPLVDLASEPEKFQQWIDEKGFWGRFAFLGIQMLQVVVAIIPGEVIEIGGGYAFGAWEGTLLCLVGVALGSAVVYALTRAFGVKLVEAFITREKIAQMKYIKNEKKLNLLIFLIFFIPGTPKDLLTYFVGLTPMKLSTFLIISSLARIPSVLSSTLGGHALGQQDYRMAIIVFVITAAVSGAGMLLYNAIVKHKNAKHAAQSPDKVPTEKKEP